MAIIRSQWPGTRASGLPCRALLIVPSLAPEPCWDYRLNCTASVNAIAANAPMMPCSTAMSNSSAWA